MSKKVEVIRALATGSVCPSGPCLGGGEEKCQHFPATSRCMRCWEEYLGWDREDRECSAGDVLVTREEGNEACK